MTQIYNKNYILQNFYYFSQKIIATISQNIDSRLNRANIPDVRNLID
jgi:hypothetical protein